MEQRKEEEKICVCVHISSFDHLTHLLAYSVRDNILTHSVSFWGELTDVQLKDPPFRQFKEDRSAINSFNVSMSFSFIFLNRLLLFLVLLMIFLTVLCSSNKFYKINSIPFWFVSQVTFFIIFFSSSCSGVSYFEMWTICKDWFCMLN